MNLLRTYLLLGLIIHKVVWEVLKPTQGEKKAGEHHSRSTKLAFVRATKIAILLGIIAQTIALDVLPIMSNPTVIRVVGTVIYTAGLLMAIVARIQLGRNWSDIEAATVLQGHRIVSNGLYRLIRHPIYMGDLLLLLGLELSLNSWLVVLVGLMAPVVLFQAMREEKMLVQTLPGYDQYCADTKRFIPFII